jgi:hypothetical protein
MVWAAVVTTPGHRGEPRCASIHAQRNGTSCGVRADDGGRGAGGHCFIKDFEAFIGLYTKAADYPTGLVARKSWRDKNVQLHRDSGKNLDLLRGVYGQIP